MFNENMIDKKTAIMRVNPKWRSMEEDEEEAKKLNEQAIAFAFGLVVLPLMSFVVYLNIWRVTNNNGQQHKNLRTDGERPLEDLH